MKFFWLFKIIIIDNQNFNFFLISPPYFWNFKWLWSHTAGKSISSLMLHLSNTTVDWRENNFCQYVLIFAFDKNPSIWSIVKIYNFIATFVLFAILLSDNCSLLYIHKR